MNLDAGEGSAEQRNIAIIADEAHRSHGRKSTRTLHGTILCAIYMYVLQSGSLELTPHNTHAHTHALHPTTEVLTGFSRQSNRISYFSFTCTPNFKALEMFGVRNDKGAYEPFHTYSIDQCIRSSPPTKILFPACQFTRFARFRLRFRFRFLL
jgi:type I site-specific restriction-modification system R (restriction) subunit